MVPRSLIFTSNYVLRHCVFKGTGIAQSPLRRATGWAAWVRFPGGKIFLLTASISALGLTLPMGTEGSFPGEKAAGAII
jgi:hypothetical protein